MDGGLTARSGEFTRKIRIAFVYREGSARHNDFMVKLEGLLNVELTRFCGVSDDTIEIMSMFAPDILITGLVMPKVDGFELMRRVRAARDLPMPVICVYTPLTSDMLLREASRGGANIYINSMAPIDFAIENLFDMYREARLGGVLIDGKRVPRNVITSETGKLLVSMGMNPSLRGFTMARDGIVLIVGDRTLLKGITRRLYPMLAKKNGAKSQGVEKVLRNAIEDTWEKGNLEIIDSLFGMSVKESNGRPTNLEFLARMADYICSKL